MRQERLLLDAPDVVRTAVSRDYVPGWGMVEALRETIQEMVDVRTKYGCRGGLRYSGNRAVIWDEGPGLKRSDLALGNSGKRGDDRLVGQFGEGLKLAALVAARNGREMVIETVGFTARPFIARDPVLDCEVLAFEIKSKYNRSAGTKITIQAAPQEVAAARSMFLNLTPRKARSARVFLPGGRVYINGCLALGSDELLFSYDLPGSAKTAQNRDRSALKLEVLNHEITKALSRLTDARLIKLLLQTVLDQRLCFEHTLNLWYAPEVEAVWIRTAKQVFGPKACRAEGNAMDQEAKRLGFTVIYSFPWRWESLLSNLGIFQSSMAIAQRGCRAKAVKITPEERRVLTWAKRLVKKHLGDPGRVRVAEDLALTFGLRRSDASGLWDRCTQTIWVRRAVLSDPQEALGTLFHEALHKISGASDCTEAFEKAWEALVVDLVMKRSSAPVIGVAPDAGGGDKKW